MSASLDCDDSAQSIDSDSIEVVPYDDDVTDNIEDGDKSDDDGNGGEDNDDDDNDDTEDESDDDGGDVFGNDVDSIDDLEFGDKGAFTWLTISGCGGDGGRLPFISKSRFCSIAARITVGASAVAANSLPL